MKIRLETFENLFILSVRQTVSTAEARILIAGISKLVSLGLEWVIVDLSHAMLDDTVIPKIDEAMEIHKKDPTSKTKVRCAGTFPTFCDFDDLSDALENSKVKDFREVSTKIELEENRENLKRILSAREVVTDYIEVKLQKIEDIQVNYIHMNRNLRAAQTHLINRLLDPVFADFWTEEKSPSSSKSELDTYLGISAPLLNPTVESIPEPARSSDNLLEVKPLSLYEATHLPDLLSEIRQEILGLQKQTRKSFYDGKADRCVSLLMENVLIRERIREVKEAWIQKLVGDSELTAEDFENGFSKMIRKPEVA
jgi:flagellar biosynthesis GTPase FlhF